MSKVYKIAIVGGGINSGIGHTHINALRMINNLQIVAGIFSDSKKINILSGKFYGVKNIYFSIDDLLNSKEKIDFIVILTPIFNRVDLIKKILKKNISLIVEKPFLSSILEFRKIKKLIKNNFVTTTYNYTGYPMVREIRNLNQKKFFGKLNKVFIEMPSGPYLEKKANIANWRLIDKDIPNTFLDLGSHVISLIYFITNSWPTKFFSNINTHGRYKNIKDDLMSFGKLDNKIDFNIWFSKSAIGYDNGLKIRLFGDKASCKWKQTNPEIIHISTSDKKHYKIDRGSYYSKISRKKRYNKFKSGHPTGFLEAFTNLYEDIFNEYEKFKKNKKIKSEYIFDIKKSYEIVRILDKLSASKKKIKNG